MVEADLAILLDIGGLKNCWKLGMVEAGSSVL